MLIVNVDGWGSDFLCVAGLRLVPDDAEKIVPDSRPRRSCRARSGLEGQAYIVISLLCILAVQRPIGGVRLGAGEYIADAGTAGQLVTPVAPAEACSGRPFGREVLGPGADAEHNRQG